MSILKSIMHHWNSTSESYDTLHPETEYAQVTDFGEGTIAHLISSALASTVTACSTGSVFGKLVEKLLDASGMRYNFSNSSVWYICLGSLFGGLIIQGGYMQVGAISWPITFTMMTIVAVHEGSANYNVWYHRSTDKILSSGAGGDWAYWIAIGK